MEEETKGLIKDETSKKIIAAAEKIATESGEVTVRKILRELGVTNRVFYNRFHNVDEVLEIVYTNTISRIRESMSVEYYGEPMGEIKLRIVSQGGKLFLKADGTPV